jgi:hypothetical protein
MLEADPVLMAARRFRRRPDLVLHIGSGKTGTSSIQFLLGSNRELLADRGWLYPSVPSDNWHRHTRFGLFVQPDERLVSENAWRREQQDSPTAFRRAFRRELTKEVRKSGLSRVLLSDEALYGSPDEALRRLRRFTDRAAGRVRLLVYLRRQDDHLISRYQQVVKVGETRRLAERIRQQDLSNPYDYHLRLSTWRRLVQPAEFVVRPFEHDRFVGGSLYQDFLDSAGLDVRATDLEPVERRNDSLDAEAVEFLRILNLHRVENEGARVGRINNRRFVVRLAEAQAGPVLTLPAGVLDDFMAMWQGSNEAVAREFLGEPDGQLFRLPRKTGDVTTDQFLDPDRLDHYFDLVELPQRLHAPLRRLAEREAAAT